MGHRTLAAARIVASISIALVASACAGRASRTTAATATTAQPISSTMSTEPSTTTTAAPAASEPASAADAATSVTAAEQAIAGGDRDPRWGRQQQVAYRALAVHPEWTAEVLAGIPAAVLTVVRDNISAATQLRQLTKPKAALPPWRIVAPAPADELLADYKAAERDTGVPWAYLAAIHFVETKLGRIRGTSDAGAKGPMQFLPATWAQYGNGGDIESNRDAIEAAARLLRHNGAPARMADALFAYNHSSLYVGAVTIYARRMQADENAFFGYYAWQVYYRLVSGDRVLAEGYGGS